MSLARVIAPGALITTAEMKAHLRVLHADEDALIDGLISAAVAHLDGKDGVLGRCLVDQGWRQEYTGFAAALLLPFPNIGAVAVVYDDADGAEQSVAAGNFELVEDMSGARIVFNDTFAWPAVLAGKTFPVRVTMTAGFGTAADVPAAITLAAKLLVAHWFENREATRAGSFEALPFGVRALLAPYRRVAI